MNPFERESDSQAAMVDDLLAISDGLRAMRKVLRAVAERRTTFGALLGLDKETVSHAWQQAGARLRLWRRDPELIEMLHFLRDLDPMFPAANYLLAIAYLQAGDNARAIDHLRSQAQHPSGVSAEESRALLEQMAAAA